jgi:hypothetical protein
VVTNWVVWVNGLWAELALLPMKESWEEEQLESLEIKWAGIGLAQESYLWTVSFSPVS